MESLTKMSLDSQIKYLIDPNLEVVLNIQTAKYKISCNRLFKMAARKNTKREFLFVSKVIGKHMRIFPNTLKIIGGILARSWSEENCEEDIEILVEALEILEICKENQTYTLNQKSKLERAMEVIRRSIKLEKKTLFIGFAETATGIAQAVFANFSNAGYIHTTREAITTISPSVLFKEEHSHATDHVIYPKNPNLLKEYEEIVLIDDELTTGKSALNLIEHLPGKTFGILSILDWRSDENIAAFNKIKDKNIKVSSLIKGTIEFNKMGELSLKDTTAEMPKKTFAVHKEIRLKSLKAIEGYLEYTGRFGMDSEKQVELEREIEEIGQLLKKERKEGNCLCLGSGEFIYIPCMISAQLGENVFFQSTTRSPIYAKDIEDYAITSKVQFKAVEDEKTENYLYNIPKDFYSQVFFFTEKPLKEKKKQEFKDIFMEFNIENIVFVFWESI